MKRGIIALTTLTLVAGCTAGPAGRERDRTELTVVPMRLVAFDSCAEALTDLRAALKDSIGPWGLGGATLFGDVTAGGARTATPQAADRDQHSTTNNHEADADEPDLVKTDGGRIVTLTGGVLRVVDAGRRTATGRLDLARVGGDGEWTYGKLLLHGDRAVILAQVLGGPTLRARSVPRPDVGRPARQAKSAVLLVDLAGPPRLTGRYEIDGELLDARKVGGTARVVVRSQPRIAFPVPGVDASDEERIAANRAAVDRAPVEDWLPRFEWTAGDERRTGQLPCDRLSRPAGHTGDSLLNLLSFDLGTGALSDGDPVGVLASGQTVYGTGDSLYIADQAGARWALTRRDPSARTETEIHRFDLTAPGRPRYVGSGSVPGHLLNQYALSEWQGHLRVATTSAGQGNRPADQPDTSSAVYVLRTDGAELRRVGEVTGLGRGERIYSVRFLGDTGHVVTFRETDPLYTLDLRDPARPRVTGELKITGYSGHLQPVGGNRLLGVGQEADARGRRQGLLVSLFDVGNPAAPTRLDRYHRPDTYSPAEHEAHALLFWPANGLLVLPVSAPKTPVQEALVLRVDGSSLTEVGRVRHPGDHRAMITRSLLVGDTLWTVSEAGLQATDPTTLRTRSWLPST